jgi:hypothetical protein
VLALTAILGTVWLARLRAARRLELALNAFAEREIARTHRAGSASSHARVERMLQKARARALGKRPVPAQGESEG